MASTAKATAPSGSERFLLYCLLGLFATGPAIYTLITGYFRDYYGLAAPLFAIEGICVLLLAMAANERRDELVRPHPVPFLAGVALAILTFGLSAFVAQDRFIALGHSTLTLTHLLLGLGIFSVFGGIWRQHRKALLWSIAIGATLQILITFAVLVDPPDFTDEEWKFFGIGVSNVRQFGFVGAILTALGLALAAHPIRRLNLLQPTILAMLGMTCVFVSGARASFGAAWLTAGLLMLAAPAEQKRQMLIVVLVSALLAVPISYLLTPHPLWGLERILGRVEIGTNLKDLSPGRYLLWVEGIERVLNRPFFGHAEGQYYVVVDVFPKPWNHPHNSLVQFLFQWGVMGTVLLATIVSYSLRGLRFAFHCDQAIALPAIAVLFALSAISMLDGTFYHTYPSQIAVVCLALIATSGATPKQASLPPQLTPQAPPLG